MCGIAGFFWGDAGAPDVLERRLADALLHRGPDSWGSWNDPAVGLSFVHRRLAILDLSAEGHQPMASATGRYEIVFNGEIYNFTVLKRELETLGAHFRGGSDTEVILAGIEAWGLPETLSRLVGMFAFAVWDNAQREIWLVRDRAGEKPLYYGWLDGRLCFSSEVKSLRFCSKNSLALDNDALGAYFQFGRVPGPLSIYRGIYKLPPGCFLRFSLDQAKREPADFSPFPGDTTLQPHRYWDPMEAYERSVGNPSAISDSEALLQVETLLKEVVSQQMIADVPVGAFLSGGIDSSLLVSVMQQVRSTPVNTFSIGFNDSAYDEAPYARAIAHHLGTAHTELYVSPQDVLQVIPQLPTIADEPLADQSQIPTFLVSRLARQSVTVSLSGDGGDELFGGYERHIYAEKILRILNSIPWLMRAAGASALLQCTPAMISRVCSLLPGGIEQQKKILHLTHKVHKTARLLTSRSEQELYVRFSSNWFDPERIFPNFSSKGLMNFSGGWPQKGTIARKFMVADLTHYLPDTILQKLDKASMAVSLESRAPFLDHRLIELSLTLPPSCLIREGKGKWILRQLLSRYLPQEVLDRPKSGFSMPIASWLRGELKPWATDLLSPRRLRQAGLYNVAPISKALDEHVSGVRDNHIQLWNLLAFEAWREKHSPG